MPPSRTTRRPLASRITALVAGVCTAVLAPLAVTAVGTASASEPASSTADEVSIAAPTDLIISEYVEGSSFNKAVELYNGTDAAIDLTTYQILPYYNGGVNPGAAINVAGTIAPGEVFVVAHGSWALDFEPDQLTNAVNFNGNDALVLVNGETVIDSFGRVGEDPGAGGWGTPPNNTTDRTLRRLPSICAGDTVIDDAFEPTDEYTVHPMNTIDGLGSHTVDCEDDGGDPEPPPPPPTCEDPVITIGEVQGTGWAPDLLGEVVSVEGVVIGDYQYSGGFNGYFIQDAGDGDDLTSDAIFINSTVPVDEGDLVRVTGLVGNDFNQSRITPTNAESVSICATDQDLPEPVVVELPLTDQQKWSHESMLVTFGQDLAILEYFNYGRFGELVIGTDRQYQPTHLFEPGSDEAQAELAANLANRITLDDGLGIQNPAFLRHPNGQAFTLENTFRGGDLVTNATGVLDYRFNLWRIQPTAPAEFTGVNERPLTVPEVGGDTTIVGFNVLNYFTTFNSRGAQNQTEFDRQEAKIVAALVDMDADIAGLIEIENNNDVALATLTDAINEELGAEVYDYVATGVVGTDEITTAYIYKKDEIAPVGDFALLNQSVDARFLDHRNRPVLAQTFQRLVDGEPAGEPITIANNHLKSKGSGCDADGDPEDPNGQGNCNGVRTQAAEAMADWLATDPTDSGADNVVIIGDLNSYAQEDPIAVLTEAGYVDLLWDRQGEDVYTYVFDGQLGYLDYALASPDANALVTGADSWYINTDEPSVLDYTTRFKPPAQQELFEPNAFRSSDHDPVIVGVQLLEEEEPVEPIDPVVRISGDDRYQTAAALAAELGPSDVAYLASGRDYPDALAAAAPAARDGAPVLLTTPNHLPRATVTALGDISPDTVYVFGSSAVISDAVLTQVEAATGAEVVRIEGTDRYGTAAAAARTLFEPSAVDTVYVTSGLTFADGLAGAPLAGLDGSPILLTREGALPGATIGALNHLQPERVVVLGGEGRVSEDVLIQLRDYAGEVERLAGGDRYETAQRIAARLPESDQVLVTYGLGYADAIAAAPYAAQQHAPILLTRTDTLPGPSVAAVRARDPEQAVVLGGEPVVGQPVLDRLAELIAE